MGKEEKGGKAPDQLGYRKKSISLREEKEGVRAGERGVDHRVSPKEIFLSGEGGEREKADYLPLKC